MTSLTYDDSIEIISYHTDDAPSGLGVSATASAASVDGTATATAYVSFSGGRRQLSDVGVGGVGRRAIHASVAGRRHPGHDAMSPQYRRMRCAVIVMASVMIFASMLLVGVSLSMAEHIDELGQTSFLSMSSGHDGQFHLFLGDGHTCCVLIIARSQKLSTSLTSI